MNQPSPYTVRMLVVIVLYGEGPEESSAFRSLQQCLSANPALAEVTGCLLYDNSPEPHAFTPVFFPCTYVHDGSNPGLARPYQTALERALQEGVPWLMLLDQDTSITEAYLHEVHSTAAASIGEDRIVAMAPKLLQDGEVLSPHWMPFHLKRGSFAQRSGVIDREIAVFNSGSVLRVSALQAIGGFPQHFPLDFLDHAVYRQLQQRGGAVLLLAASLNHHLASKNSNFIVQFRSSWRMHSIALAQSRYYRLHGNGWERIFHVLRRSLVAVRMSLRGNVKGAWILMRYTLFPS